MRMRAHNTHTHGSDATRKLKWNAPLPLLVDICVIMRAIHCLPLGISVCVWMIFRARAPILVLLRLAAAAACPPARPPPALSLLAPPPLLFYCFSGLHNHSHTHTHTYAKKRIINSFHKYDIGARRWGSDRSDNDSEGRQLLRRIFSQRRTPW